MPRGDETLHEVIGQADAPLPEVGWYIARNMCQGNRLGYEEGLLRPHGDDAAAVGVSPELGEETREAPADLHAGDLGGQDEIVEGQARVFGGTGTVGVGGRGCGGPESAAPFEDRETVEVYAHFTASRVDSDPRPRAVQLAAVSARMVQLPSLIPRATATMCVIRSGFRRSMTSVADREFVLADRQPAEDEVSPAVALHDLLAIRDGDGGGRDRILRPRIAHTSDEPTRLQFAELRPHTRGPPTAIECAGTPAWGTGHPVDSSKISAVRADQLHMPDTLLAD